MVDDINTHAGRKRTGKRFFKPEELSNRFRSKADIVRYMRENRVSQTMSEACF